MATRLYINKDKKPINVKPDGNWGDVESAEKAVVVAEYISAAECTGDPVKGGSEEPTKESKEQ